MKRWKRLWKGTLPLFLVLWAVMLCILGKLNAESQNTNIQWIMEDALRRAEADYTEIWAGGASEAEKPVLLTWRLGSELNGYSGIAQLRFYDAEGQELARSQMAKGCACLPGTGVYDWFFLLDPVLTQEEQLALAELLREDRGLQTFYGSIGGLMSESETDERYCEVAGAVDRERQVIYPKTITYVYADRELTLVDSGSDFFAEKELTTLRFDYVQITSALEDLNAPPEEMLRRWQEAEEKLDGLLAGHLPSLNATSSSSDGSQCGAISDNAILASAYAYSPLRLVIQTLWPTALVTLLAAIAMALHTDKKQREAIARERAFTRVAAHELKTPLAILRTHAEALREDIAPEKREQYLDIVLDESDRMAELVGRLLELSRLESGAALDRETVDLTALVREVWAPLSLQLEQKEITLALELEEIRTEGDRARLKEAMENLASNALRHSSQGGKSYVRLERQGPQASLSVYNDGPAVPEEDLPHLFEPFYRGDKSRGRDSGGTGLGLAIVRAAVLAHGGECFVENREGGVSVGIRLPLADARPRQQGVGPA